MKLHTENVDRERAQEAANWLTASYDAPPIPVLEIARSCGVDVIFWDFANYNNQVAGLCDFKTARLLVNSDDPASRQKFTIAHELGHWLLHKDYFLDHEDEYPVLLRQQKPDTSDPREQEANHFAAHLLVPTHLLMPVKSVPSEILARVFGVSALMMGIRLKNLSK